VGILLTLTDFNVLAEGFDVVIFRTANTNDNISFLRGKNVGRVGVCGLDPKRVGRMFDGLCKWASTIGRNARGVISFIYTPTFALKLRKIRENLRQCS
jgi:hypothetical protein